MYYILGTCEPRTKNASTKTYLGNRIERASIYIPCTRFTWISYQNNNRFAGETYTSVTKDMMSSCTCNVNQIQTPEMVLHLKRILFCAVPKIRMVFFTFNRRLLLKVLLKLSEKSADCLEMIDIEMCVVYKLQLLHHKWEFNGKRLKYNLDIKDPNYPWCKYCKTTFPVQIIVEQMYQFFPNILCLACRLTPSDGRKLRPAEDSLGHLRNGSNFVTVHFRLSEMLVILPKKNQMTSKKTQIELCFIPALFLESTVNYVEPKDLRWFLVETKNITNLGDNRINLKHK